MQVKKILFALPHPWYIENHMEYIIKHLGHKYMFDIGMIGDSTIFGKDPDDYDLLVALLTSHPHLHPREDYDHKLAGVVWEVKEITNMEGMCYASTNRLTDEWFRENDRPWVQARIGIDAHLFRPGQLARDDDLLHVGFVGKAHSQRKQVKDLLIPLIDLEGIRLMFFSQQDLPPKEVEYCGGKAFLDRVAGGSRVWTAMPNIYNQLDVLIETDADPSVSFPALDAAACEVPVINPHGGVSQDLVDAGAAIHILPDDDMDPRLWAYEKTDEMAKKIRDAVILLRDNPNMRKKMGKAGRKEIITNWSWDKWIPQWDNFFQKCLALLEKK